MKNYEVQVFDYNFRPEDRKFKTKDKGYNNLIEDTINTRTDESFDGNEEYTTLHSVIPIYDDENNLENFIVIYKDDKKRENVHFILEKDEIENLSLTYDKINLIMKIKIITLDEKEYSIINSKYNLNDDELYIYVKAL